MADRQNVLEAAQDALANGDWVAARDGFGAAVEQAPTPEALAGLAEALWWLGEVPQALSCGERAYAGYQRRDEGEQAVEMALWLALRHDANLGNDAAATGWLARARTLSEERGLERLRGWVLLHDSARAESVPGEALAREALDVARAHRDRDLELCATSQIGATLVDQGRIRDGMGYLDEAMAASLGGEAGLPSTVVYTSCNTISSCTACRAFDHGVQWIRAADRFMRRFGCPFLDARCRVHYGRLLVSVGDWVQAGKELQAAVQLSQDAQPAVHAEALATLADLRLAQGRIDEARRLVRGLGDLRGAVATRARIDLACGRPSVVEANLRRWLAEMDDETLEALELGDLLGRAELALGEGERALERARRLEAAAERIEGDFALARAARLHGLALAATADPDLDAARTQLERALLGFTRAGLPLEVAQTRFELGRLLGEVASEVAIEELQQAFDGFEAVGAAREADAAAGLLRDLGATVSRVGPRGTTALSNREQEVLALVGEGLSNAEIGERLYISRRTVEHHVAQVRMKLGLRNREEAVAAAVRLGLGEPEVTS
jgi:DNA-binding CsgD family transcriptional regulator